MLNAMGLGDRVSVEQGKGMIDGLGLWGKVVAEKYNKDGLLVARCETHNLITDVGDQYYAARAAQRQGSALTISAIATGTTASVTTSTAHGLSVGDVVTIAGVTPTGYNGKWAVTGITSSTVFTIYVGTALGAGTAFGTATGLSVSLASGMKLGTGSTAVAKNGAGAALTTYLTGSQQAFDSGFPTVVDTAGAGSDATYKVTYAAGTATTASPITEVVIVNENILANATTAAANTISRALITGVGSKGASDTLTVTWSHTLLGA